MKSAFENPENGLNYIGEAIKGLTSLQNLHITIMESEEKNLIDESYCV